MSRTEPKPANYITIKFTGMATSNITTTSDSFYSTNYCDPSAFCSNSSGGSIPVRPPPPPERLIVPDDEEI